MVNIDILHQGDGMYFIPLELQGAYPRYEIHTSVFAV